MKFVILTTTPTENAFALDGPYWALRVVESESKETVDKSLQPNEFSLQGDIVKQGEKPVGVYFIP